MNPFALPQRLRRFQVEITTGCNLACAGCPRTIGIDEGHWKSKHMSVKKFASVIANAPPSEIIVLQGVGEPTLHPKLPEMIRLAKASKKFTHVSFNTNGLFRDLKYYLDLRKGGLDHVSVSVDSLNPETAEKTRSGTNVTMLREAIRFLVKLFGGGTTLSIVLSKMNLAELPDLLSELFALGGRTIEIQPLIAYAPGLESVRLSAHEIIEAKRIAAAAMAKHKDLNVLQAPAMNPSDRRCMRPMWAGYVTVDGLMTPCCTTERTDLFGRANLAEKPFADLWNSPKVTAWYSRFYSHDDEICAGCSFNPQGLGRTRLEAPESSGLAARTEHAGALQRQGRIDEAATQFRGVLDEAGSIDALRGLGEVALQRGDHVTAAKMLEAAQQLAPSGRTAHNLAWARHGAGQHDDAIALMHRTVNENPEYAAAYFSLARMLAERNDRASAAGVLIVLLRKALAARNATVIDQASAQLMALDTDHPQMLEIANHLRLGNRADIATALLDSALKRHPGDLSAMLVRAMARLPVVYADAADIDTKREAYAADLRDFAVAVNTAPASALVAAFEQIGQAKPFYLSYQGRDDRALQEMYGDAVCRIAHAKITGLPVPASPPKPGEKLRVGFASNYFFQHSVSKLFRGWVEQLDRSGFEIFVYNLFGGDADAWASATAAKADHTRHKLGGIAEWTKAIAADRLHALIYPEVGMETLAVRLAAQRLARVQCMAWGHPVTAGLPTIDYFLSSELMEAEGSDAQYREKLVRLPGLSIYYEPLSAITGTLTRKSLGPREDATVFLACQALYKYQPAYDHVFPAIAAKVPDAQFMFIADGNPATTEVVRNRLMAAFSAQKLDGGKYLVFTSPVAPAEFPALLRAGDVYLDGIGWSGGNTTLEAATCGLPIVTLPGPLMRSRHSAAILKQMGLEQFIAGDEAGYIDLAIKLGTDSKARAQAAKLVAARRDRLYRDLRPVRALETFLRDAVVRAG